MSLSFLKKDCLVFGCGNTLFGDDGFGPEVVDQLKRHYSLPEHVECIDAGTSIQGMLFDILLSQVKPRQIIIVDTVIGKAQRPGQIREIDVDEIQPAKRSNFSVHEFPSMDMLMEIKERTGIDLHVLVVEAGHIPTQVAPGLSKPVKVAVPEMCKRVLSILAGR